MMNVLYLDGKKGYVELPSSITNGLTESTIEVWIRFEKFNKWSRIFDFGRKGNAVVVSNEKKSSKFRFEIWNKYGKSHKILAKNIIKQGKWHHIAAVLSREEGMSFYIDGIQVGGSPFKVINMAENGLWLDGISPKIGGLHQYGHVVKTIEKNSGGKTLYLSTGSLDDVSGGRNYIGKSHSIKDEFFFGYLTEFRIWNTARNQDQI